MGEYDGYTFVFDVDGTICPIKSKDESYADLVPYPDVVRRMREYHDGGAKIVLYSSRNMNTYNCDVGLINKHTAPVMLEWLNKWDIPYDAVHFGKVWPGHKGFYVDDRSVRPDEFLSHSVEELEQICEDSRRRTKGGLR